MLLGAGGQERLGGLDGLRQRTVRAAGGDGLPATQPGHGGRHLRAGRHAAVGPDGVAALYAEPAALAWSRTIGGVTQEPRSTSLLWYAQLWAVRQPRIDQQHDAVAARAVARRRRRARDRGALRSPDAEFQPFTRRSGGIGRRASLRGWCPQGRGGSSPPSDTHFRC